MKKVNEIIETVKEMNKSIKTVKEVLAKRVTNFTVETFIYNSMIIGTAYKSIIKDIPTIYSIIYDKSFLSENNDEFFNAMEENQKIFDFKENIDDAYKFIIDALKIYPDVNCKYASFPEKSDTKKFEELLVAISKYFAFINAPFIFTKEDISDILTNNKIIIDKADKQEIAIFLKRLSVMADKEYIKNSNVEVAKKLTSIDSLEEEYNKLIFNKLN